MSGLDRTSQMQRSREPTQAALIDGQWLDSICRTVPFEPGDVLRRKGAALRDMYWLTEGRVNVDLETGAAPPIERTPGSPIGEVAFLSGRPATATVTARTAASALFIDDPTFARLAREQPILTAELLRHLAEVAEERTSSNLTFVSTPASYAKRPLIDVYLCRSQAMLASAQRLRYDVYCQELGRTSPYADHDKRVITDHLDESGHVFIAVEAGETIGTLRGNVPSEGSLGVLDELYGKVLNESLRLYPSAPVIVRDIIEDVEIDGAFVPAGTIGIIPIYAIHRHRLYWDEPDRFDPDRFAPDRSKPTRYQFLPFGAGPRICIGAAFAMVEATIMLATFVRAARFALAPDFDPQPSGRMFLLPKNGMPLQLTLGAGAA
jgi:CRP-like cAMP-binding protein